MMILTSVVSRWVMALAATVVPGVREAALVEQPVATATADAATEYWIGQILVPNPACAQITFVVTLTKKGEGWTGRLSMSPGCGVNGMFDVALEGVARTETLSFVTPPPPNRNTYELTLSKDEKSGTGRIVIGGVQPLYIRASRVSEAEARNAAPRRPQTPAEPLPYERREVMVKTTGPSGSLAGILTIPKGEVAAARPAALLLADEEIVDADHTEGTHKPGQVLADLLTRRGVVVLRCASPGVGGSPGTYLASTMADAAADAAGVVAYLKTVAGVDPERVVVIGRGEGSYTAARVAAETGGAGGVGGVVLMAPAAMSWKDLLLVRERKQFATQGEDPAYVSARLERYRKILDAAAKSDPDALGAALTEDYDALTKAGRAMGMLNAFQQRDSLQVQADYYLTPRIVSRLNENAKEYLEKVRVPVLLLAGGRDVQTPAAETLAGVEAALKAAGNGKVTTRTLATANHWFQPCVTGFGDERDQIETTMDPQVAEVIAEWIAGVGKQ